MSLRRYSEARPTSLTAALLLVVLMVTGGCASSGKVAETPRSIPATAQAQLANAEEVSPQAQTLFEQATSVLASGDLVEAELRFEEFVLQYPGMPGAHVNLAIIHARNGDDAAAESSLTDALLLDPQHVAGLNQLGMLLRRQGRFEDAEAAYLRALEADPGYVLAHYNLGVLYELYLRRLEPALEHFEWYQSLGGSDEAVEKWIVDLKRRIAADQRAANVTE